MNDEGGSIVVCLAGVGSEGRQRRRQGQEAKSKTRTQTKLFREPMLASMWGWRDE